MSGGRAAVLVTLLLPLLTAVALPAGAAAPAAAEPETAAAPPPGAGEQSPVSELLKEAEAAFAREDYGRAKRLYEEVVRLDPGRVRAVQRLALLQSWDGELQASVRNYRLAMALSPDDATVLLGLGSTLSLAGRYAEAESVLSGMEERRIEPIKAHIERARLRVRQGDLSEAEHFWRDVLRADPGNLDARIGMAYVHHFQGHDRTALEQADNIANDHPESKEALALRETIHTSLRPRAEADTIRFSDTDSNREDVTTASYTFRAKPQTSIRIAFSAYDAGFRCEDAQLCDEPGLVIGDEVGTRAQVLTGALTTQVVSPVIFNARLGAVREETFGGNSRLVGVLGGYLRWQVGPRFLVGTHGGRDVLLDTAPLIDRGLRITDANAQVEFRFKPAWLLSGSAGAASLSDGNARRSAGAAIAWHPPVNHPKIAGTFAMRYRAFNEDKDNGYFDPQRYDSEILSLSFWDADRHGRLHWRLEGNFGRQAFTTGPSEDDGTVSGGTALAGINFAQGRAVCEASYTRSNDALGLAQGFPYSRTQFTFRFRF